MEIIFVWLFFCPGKHIFGFGRNGTGTLHVGLWNRPGCRSGDFPEKIILIAGGYDKKISYMPLAEEILRSTVREILLCGDTADAIEGCLRELDPDAARRMVTRCADLAECVSRAREKAREGDVVLFSPASASFDAYPNFEVRGRHFKQMVGEL